MPAETAHFEQAVRDAVLALFGASGTAAFCLTLKGTTPPLFIAAGEPGQMAMMVAVAANDDVEVE